MPIGIDSTQPKKKSSWLTKISIGIVLLIVLLLGVGYLGFRGVVATAQLESLYVDVHNIVWVKNDKSISEKENAIVRLQKFDGLVPQKKFLGLRADAVMLARRRIDVEKKITNNNVSMDTAKEAMTLKEEYEDWKKRFDEIRNSLYESR